MPQVKILVGDWVEQLRTLEDGSVHCCVTSPPYWGLRDYGVKGQLGLEKTPEEYVSKVVSGFAEVRRVLRDDGTLWLNLGDCYATTPPGCKGVSNSSGLNGVQAEGYRSRLEKSVGTKRNTIAPGLKPKDLVGIPWRVARALQEPYYTGMIKDVQDRIWLAAMIDAEGCMFIHKRKAGQSNGQGYARQNDSYGPGLEIANTSEAIVNRCLEIVGRGSICSQTPDQNNRRKQTIYRYNIRLVECRDIVREIYPHLVGKQHQARILCGCPSSGPDADKSHQSLIALHNGGTASIDFDPPQTMFEKGWYLRSDIIWSKCNPMPESVTDRPTKAHEYIFLLSKSQKYYYDQDAIREPWGSGRDDMREKGVRTGTAYLQQSENSYSNSVKPPPRSHNGSVFNKGKTKEAREHLAAVGNGERNDNPLGRNKRTVWTVATSPYSEAHFATFPPDLIKPCILAGCPVGGTVLDPFFGSGTTGQVALELGRKCIGIELNPKYVKLAEQRTNVTPGLPMG